jgi:hypothetical protein
VRRGATPWLLSVPLALAGCLAAHELTYRIVEPDAHQRTHLLAASGHGYLGQLRLLLAVGLALVLATFVRQALLAARGLEPRGPSRLVALVPPLAFALQEYGERLFHDGAFPVETFTEPTFVVGLALQLPFALVALAAAALLTRTARALGRLLARPPLAPARAVLRSLASTSRPRPAHRAPARGRAPPLLARP